MNKERKMSADEAKLRVVVPEPPSMEKIKAMALSDTSVAMTLDAPEITMGDVGRLARAYLHIKRLPAEKEQRQGERKASDAVCRCGARIVALDEEKQFWRLAGSGEVCTNGHWHKPVTDSGAQPLSLRQKINANLKATGDWMGRTPEEKAARLEESMLDRSAEVEEQREEEAPTHSLNCPAWHNAQGQEVNAEDCTCGLRWRIALQTEQTMHAAWRKRAEEAEARESELLKVNPSPFPPAEVLYNAMDLLQMYVQGYAPKDEAQAAIDFYNAQDHEERYTLKPVEPYREQGEVQRTESKSKTCHICGQEKARCTDNEYCQGSVLWNSASEARREEARVNKVAKLSEILAEAQREGDEVREEDHPLPELYIQMCDRIAASKQPDEISRFVHVKLACRERQLRTAIAQLSKPSAVEMPEPLVDDAFLNLRCEYGLPASGSNKIARELLTWRQWAEAARKEGK